MRVELDVTVTSLLGTVIIRRHLGGQLRAHFVVVENSESDITQGIACRFRFSKSLVRLICFNTIQPVTQHVKEECRAYEKGR